MDMLDHVLIANSLLTAFAFVGLLMWLSAILSKYFTFGRIHGSAIAILLGLALAFFSGLKTGGEKGLADIPVLAGIGLMGGALPTGFSTIATSTLTVFVPGLNLIGLAVASVTSGAYARSIGQLFIEHFENGAAVDFRSLIRR